MDKTEFKKIWNYLKKEYGVKVVFVEFFIGAFRADEYSFIESRFAGTMVSLYLNEEFVGYIALDKVNKLDSGDIRDIMQYKYNR